MTKQVNVLRMGLRRRVGLLSKLLGVLKFSAGHLDLSACAALDATEIRAPWGLTLTEPAASRAKFPWRLLLPEIFFSHPPLQPINRTLERGTITKEEPGCI